MKSLLIAVLLCLSGYAVEATTDYSTPEKREQSGEYKSVHDDIQTIGEKERVPTWEEMDAVRKKNLEKKTEPAKPEDNQKLYTEDQPGR